MKVGITFSCFDLLHAGHAQMLREAKDQCDYLIAALQTDPTIDRPEKNRPIQSLVERHIQLSSVKYVDEIITYQTENDVIDILNMFKIDVRIIGKEYENKDFTGRLTCKNNKIEIYYNNRTHGFSSSNLRERIANRCDTDYLDKIEMKTWSDKYKLKV